MLILFTCISLSSQWHIGPKFAFGGITQRAAVIPIMPMTDYYSYDMEYVGSTSVQSIGFMAYNNLGPVFLQSEIMATSYALDFSVGTTTSDGIDAQIYREKFYSIEIPFAAGVHYKNFKFGVGPVLEFNVDKESELSIMEDYVDRSKKTDFGFHGLIGYRSGIFHFDLKYVYKFASMVDDFSFSYDEFLYKKSANRLTLGVGVAF
jgi:hypothetical protein